MRSDIKQAPTRHCEACGEKLTRHRFNGRLEDYSRFLTRRTCNHQCAGALLERDVLANDKQYCQRARKLRGQACEACGSAERLQAHHIDYNRRNNDPTNIQTLCIHCHVTHHHRATAMGVHPAGRWTHATSTLDGGATP